MPVNGVSFQKNFAAGQQDKFSAWPGIVSPHGSQPRLAKRHPFSGKKILWIQRNLFRAKGNK
jgi:hypothetical protein